MDNFCFLHQIDIFTPIGARELLKRQYFEAKYFWSKYFLKSLKLSIFNGSGKNQFGAENTSGPVFYSSSSRVLQMFFNCQIFSVAKVTQMQMAIQLSVCPSVIKTPQPLRIAPIDHRAY